MASDDRDNRVLIYKVYRVGRTRPVAIVRRASTFWHRPTFAFTDRRVRHGQRVSYQVQVSDGKGQARRSVASNIVRR